MLQRPPRYLALQICPELVLPVDSGTLLPERLKKLDCSVMWRYRLIVLDDAVDAKRRPYLLASARQIAN